MTDQLRKKIVRSVLNYFKTYPASDYNKILRIIRATDGLDITRAELKEVVIPMIASGKLRYCPGLKVGLGD